MKIIFFGSDDFAAVHLEQILACGHEVLAVSPLWINRKAEA